MQAIVDNKSNNVFQDLFKENRKIFYFEHNHIILKVTLKQHNSLLIM
jgi:hypothetical protein